MGKSTISMAIFNSYVSLPEGITNSYSLIQSPTPAGNIPPASKDTVARPLRAVASAKTCWEVTLENMRR